MGWEKALRSHEQRTQTHLKQIGHADGCMVGNPLNHAARASRVAVDLTGHPW